MTELLIGIDLGGTNVRVGVVSSAGEMLAGKNAPIEAQRGPQVGLAKIAAMIEDLLRQANQARLLGIGIGSTGPIDRQKGAIQNPYTLPTWEDVDIVSALSERFGVPVALENDADAAALGEAWVGVGHSLSRMAAVTVGTGIGTAFILNGQIYRGMQGLHPEGGHIPIDPSGPECYCGARGCWESLASGPGIARLAINAVAEKGGLLLELSGGDLEQVDARLLARAARQGDLVASEVVERAAFYLGLGLVSLITLYLPEGIVLSGGVMEAYDLFAPGIEAVIAQHNVMAPISQVQILLSKLKGQAGVLGAARAVLNILQESAL